MKQLVPKVHWDKKDEGQNKMNISSIIAWDPPRRGEKSLDIQSSNFGEYFNICFLSVKYQN